MPPADGDYRKRLADRRLLLSRDKQKTGREKAFSSPTPKGASFNRFARGTIKAKDGIPDRIFEEGVKLALPDPKILSRAASDPMGTIKGAAEVASLASPAAWGIRAGKYLKGDGFSLTGADMSDVEQAVEVAGLVPQGKGVKAAGKISNALLRNATGLEFYRPMKEAGESGVRFLNMGFNPDIGLRAVSGSGAERVANDLGARKAAFDALVGQAGNLFTPKSVGMQSTIPFRAAMGYGLEREVDPVWAEGAMRAEKIISGSGRPALVGLTTGTQADTRIIKTGKDTLGRAKGEARKSGALISVKDAKTGGTIGSRVQSDVTKIVGPHPLGQQRMATLLHEGRIQDESFMSDLYPGANAGELSRAGNMLASARGTEGIFTVLKFDNKTNSWRHMGTDEVDHNPVGQRLLYRAGASLLDRAGTRSTKARKNYEDQIAKAYAILSGRLDVTPRSANQMFGSNLRTGDMTDPAYVTAGNAGLRRQLEFLVDEGHMLRIHEDNWNLLKETAPDVAREIEMLTRMRGFVDEMGNPFINSGLLY